MMKIFCALLWAATICTAAASAQNHPPGLELLGDREITELLDSYMSEFPPLSGSPYSYVHRATHVLYNIKSDKVRRAYVWPALIRTLYEYGYTGMAQGLFEDIAMCVKDKVFLQQAADLEGSYKKLDAGNEAPEINMEDADGRKFRLSDHRGKYVLLHVWNAGSEGELKAFDALRIKYPHANFAAIAVSADPENNRPGIRATDTNAFADDYKIGVLPRYILIDAEGRIMNAWFTRASDFFLTNRLEAALNPENVSH